MGKLISLDRDCNIKLKSDIEKYITPDFIYIPITNLRLNIKLGQYINKETKICDDSYAPVSGTLKGLKECFLSDGKRVKCLAIENDLIEKTQKPISSRKNISNLSQKDFLNLIENNDLREKFNKPFSLILVSGIDDEVYVENATFIQKKFTKEVLEMLETLQMIFKVKVYISVKNTNTEVINAYENYWGIYDDIELKLVDDLYLIGKEQFLASNLNISDDYLYLTINDIYNLWINIKKNHKITEKIITLSGNALNNPQVVLIKLGTSISWIIDNICQFNGEYDIYLNGIMQGKKLESYKNYIVDEKLDSILFMKKENIKPKNCINCGACLDICPINSNPVEAYLHHKKIKCINCGLCTYICPAYINLRKYIREDEE